MTADHGLQPWANGDIAWAFRDRETVRTAVAGGVVLESEQGDARAAAFEPVVRAGVDREHFALARPRRPPLAVAVIGGLLIAMILSLFVTPTIYYYMTRRGGAKEA